MAIGLIGRKAGMTRVFTEDGVDPVTLIEVCATRVTQIKTEETDGYRALQVTVGQRRASRVTKPMVGHFAKAGVEPGRGLWEFRLAEGEGAEISVGAEFKADLFQVGQKVDVTGTSIGKGFAGVIAAITSVASVPPTATRSLIAPPVLLVKTRARAGCSRARKCAAISRSAAQHPESGSHPG